MDTLSRRGVGIGLRCTNAKSDKFWMALADGRTLHCAYGRYGQAGQSSTKPFPSAEACQAELIRRIDEKLMKKGYSTIIDAAVFPVMEPQPREDRRRWIAAIIGAGPDLHGWDD